MDHETPHSDPPWAWEKTATLVVFAMAAAAFLYIGYGYYRQRTFNGLTADLLSLDAAKSGAAAQELAATDDALPYLADALINDPRPENRELSCRVLLDRLNAKKKFTLTIEDKEAQQKILRSGLNLEGVSRALSDESPEVRAAARAVVDLVGTHANYQRNRLDEMRQYEELLQGLNVPDGAQRQAAAEAFRVAGDRALPYLVGVVFSEDRELRRRGLAALHASVQEILKSSNQRRIVPLLERRRCRLLLREMTRLDAADRDLVTEVLNVSGLLPADFFSEFLKAWPSLDPPARENLLAERVEFLETQERLRGALGAEIEKVRKLHDKTGETK